MKSWGRHFVALSAALAAFATWGAAQAQEISVVDLALVAGSPIQFHALSAPPAPLALQRMVQDRYGFLWLSASDGLRRYDGYGFMKVPDDQHANSVGHMIGHSLAIDRAGRLWIGADNSLNRYDPATGGITPYRSPNDDCGTVRIAHDIVEDQDGVIWLATDDGLTALDPATSKTTCHRPRYTASVGETRVIAMAAVQDGSLWVTSSEGLYVLDRRTGKVTRHIKLETGSGRKFVFTGFPSETVPGQQRKAVGRPVLRRRPGLGRRCQRRNHGLRVPGQRTGANASSGVVTIREDHDRALWLGTNRLGLVKLTADRKQAIWYQSSPDDPEGLRDDLVVDLFKDRDGASGR